MNGKDEALLRLEDVSKTFRMGEVEVRVLQNVDLQIAEGEFTTVVGPSGSGKTTLLNIVGGVDSPTTGQVWFEQLNLTVSSETELTTYRRENVGFVFQFYNLIPTLTALENVRVATQISRHPMDPREALELVGLGHRVDHFPAQMSGGEQQRVSIARAMAGRPRMLLCDEPTGALDFETGKAVLGVLAKLNRENALTVILITHNSSIAQMANRVVRIRSGTIAESSVNPAPVRAEEISW